jgi:hypothetical protein
MGLRAELRAGRFGVFQDLHDFDERIDDLAEDPAAFDGAEFLSSYRLEF